MGLRKIPENSGNLRKIPENSGKFPENSWKIPGNSRITWSRQDCQKTLVIFQYNPEISIFIGITMDIAANIPENIPKPSRISWKFSGKPRKPHKTLKMVKIIRNGY